MSSPSKKLPAFQFYPGDWRKDPGIQSLTYHDRGIWFEILCLMHECNRRGELLVNAKPMQVDALARLLGVDVPTLTATIDTLLETGVASRDTSSGSLISRRMVRDEKLRQIRTTCGTTGGRPVLVNQNLTSRTNLVNQNLTSHPKIPTMGVNQNLTPSSSVSSSVSKDQEEGKGSGGQACEKSARLNLSKLTDLEFVDFLKGQPAYVGIDVAREISKMHVWANVNRRTVTRKFTMNWLNKIDKPLQAGGAVDHSKGF